MTAAVETPEVALEPMSPEKPWITRQFDRFWSLFRTRSTYSIGVDYRCLSEKQPIKVAVNVAYSKYFWDRSIGRSQVEASTFGGSTSMGGDPLAVGIVSEVKALNGRFLRTELDKMRGVLQVKLADRVKWLDIRIEDVELYQYGQAAVEEKKK